MADIEARRLVLRPIDTETALALLGGSTPPGLVVAEDYPSQFSLEVMDLVAGARRGEVRHFGPYFLVRRSDAVVIGEIGAFLDASANTAQVGYSVVRSCCGRGVHDPMSTAATPGAFAATPGAFAATPTTARCASMLQSPTA